MTFLILLFANKQFCKMTLPIFDLSKMVFMQSYLSFKSNKSPLFTQSAVTTALSNLQYSSNKSLRPVLLKIFCQILENAKVKNTLSTLSCSFCQNIGWFGKYGFFEKKNNNNKKTIRQTFVSRSSSFRVVKKII